MIHVAPATPSPKAKPLTHKRSAAKVRRGMRLRKVTASTEQKRRQHADAERQRSQRKEREVVQMRTELEELEDRFLKLQMEMTPEQLCALKQQYESSEVSRRKYLDALIYAGHLRREKLYLQAQLQNLNIIVAAAESALKDFGISASQTEREYLFREFHLHETLHETRCIKMALQLYYESLRFQVTGNMIEYNANGWMGRSAINGTELSFSISKVIEIDDIERVRGKTWAAFHDLSRGKRMFSATASLEVMQRVTNDMSILRRTIRHSGKDEAYHCVNFIFRFKTTDGYLLCVRTLDDLSRKLLDEHQQEYCDVVDQFYWIKLTRRGGNYYDVCFAGCLNNGTIEYATNRLREIHIALMIWESEFTRPVFKFLE